MKEICSQIETSIWLQISFQDANIFGSSIIQIIDITFYAFYSHIVIGVKIFTAVFLEGGLELLVYHHVGRGSIVFNSIRLQIVT